MMNHVAAEVQYFCCELLIFYIRDEFMIETNTFRFRFDGGKSGHATSQRDQGVEPLGLLSFYTCVPLNLT